MRSSLKILLLGVVLGGVTLYVIGALTGDNALSSIYTYLLFAILFAVVMKTRLFNSEHNSKNTKVRPFVYFAIGFFTPYVILFYYFGKAVSNISLF